MIRIMPMSGVARRRIMPTLLSMKRPPTGTSSLCVPACSVHARARRMPRHSCCSSYADNAMYASKTQPTPA